MAPLLLNLTAEIFETEVRLTLILTLIQLCGVRMDPTVTEIVTLNQNSCRGPCGPHQTGLGCNFFTTV